MIYFACLSVCLLVSNKRQKVWTDLAQIFGGAFRDPRVRFMDNQIFKNLPVTKFDFGKFWNSMNGIWSAKFCFVFVLQCKQREIVHNWNKEAYFFLFQ